MKDNRKRLEICDWRHELPVTVQSKGTHYSAKSKARGIMTELDIGRKLGIDPGLVTDILDTAREFIRNGYDVQLCRGIHLYVCVDRLKTPFIAAKDKMKRISGANMTAAFLSSLPKKWTKQKLELDATAINNLGVSDADLAEHDLVRPGKAVWSRCSFADFTFEPDCGAPGRRSLPPTN